MVFGGDACYILPMTTDTHDHGLWTHDHRFLGHGHEQSERRATLAATVAGIATTSIMTTSAGNSTRIEMQRPLLNEGPFCVWAE